MTTTTRRLAAFLGALVVLVLATGTAVAANSRPAGMSPAEYRAMMIRGQALNDKYGLSVPAGMTAAQYRAMMIRGQALNDKYGLGVPAGMTAAQWRAMVVRAQALNDLYAPTAAPSAPAAPVATVSPAGFDWTDAGIGAAVVAGVALLGAGVALSARHAHWHPHVRVS